MLSPPPPCLSDFSSCGVRWKGGGRKLTCKLLSTFTSRWKESCSEDDSPNRLLVMIFTATALPFHIPAWPYVEPSLATLKKSPSALIDSKAEVKFRAQQGGKGEGVNLQSNNRNCKLCTILTWIWQQRQHERTQEGHRSHLCRPCRMRLQASSAVSMPPFVFSALKNHIRSGKEKGLLCAIGCLPERMSTAQCAFPSCIAPH